MNLLGSMRTKMSGQTQEKFGEGERYPLTKDLIRSIREHMNEFYRTDLSKYRFERRHSDYPDAKSDIVIYDPEERVAFHGREARDGRVAVWR
ncbi:MAG: hypothetical protein AB7P33_16955 [Dehalococcoidia bacterium]